MRAFFVDIDWINNSDNSVHELGLLVDAAELSEAVNLATAFINGVHCGIEVGASRQTHLRLVGVRNKPVRGKAYLPPKEFKL